MKRSIILLCIIAGSFAQDQKTQDSLNARKKYSYVGDLSEHLYGEKGEFGCLDNLPVPSWFKGNTIVDIEVDCQGNIYIADKRNKRVMKFNKAGKFIWQTESKILPLDIEVDKQGNLYVIEGPTVDILYDCPEDITKGIYKYSPDGKVIGHYKSIIPHWENYGTVAIKSNDDIVFIEGSSKKYWIKSFEQDFSVIIKDTINIYAGPLKICIGDSQNIYLLNGNRLKKLNADFKNIWSIDLPLSYPNIWSVDPSLSYPWPNQSNVHIAFDFKNNYILILLQAKEENKKSQLITLNTGGAIVDTIPLIIKPYRFIMSDPNGNFFLALFDSTIVFIYDDKESLLTKVKSNVNFKGQYFRPDDIKFVDNRICIFDFTLGKKMYYDKLDRFLGEMNIVQDDTMKVKYPDVDFKKAEAPMRFRKCVKDGSGYLYFLFSGYGGYHAIQIFNSKLHFIREIILPPTESLFSYEDIVVSQDGYIFVTHSFGHILIYNINGENLGKFGQGNFASEPVDCGSGLYRIAVDDKNNIYAIDQISNTIKKFAIVK